MKRAVILSLLLSAIGCKSKKDQQNWTGPGHNESAPAATSNTAIPPLDAGSDAPR